MGTIIVQNETTVNPITLIGKEAGVCYGSDITSDAKNYKRGLMNLASGHGRVLEFPQVYLEIDGYSARVIRELYTHIGGAPTRVQASTRYIKYGEFEYIIPPSIAKNPETKSLYESVMHSLSNSYKLLEDANIPKEDIANILPLGMSTKVVLRTNLRNLIDMSHQRLCTRAYWEYRQLMKDIMNALKDYSAEWAELVEKYFIPKCEVCGYCEEHNTCGRMPSKKDFNDAIKYLRNREDDLK